MQDTPSNKKKKWRENFEQVVVAEHGFFHELSDEHKVLFVEQGKTLVVTFENLDDARQDAGNRLPWGMDFLTSHGWSAMGIMAHGHTWYRDPAIFTFFDQMRKNGFFTQFERVVFYGVSMGGVCGYGLCVLLFWCRRDRGQPAGDA